MSKYDPLYEHLLYSGRDSVSMTFEEIERVIGRSLPPSARKLKEWWANNPTGHTQARAWHTASYKTQRVDLAGGSVTFVLDLPGGGGFMDAKQSVYEAAGEQPPAEYESSPEKRRHPAFGSLRGTTIVKPGFDLTTPTYLLLDDENDE
jgi:hypothetical protein